MRHVPAEIVAVLLSTSDEGWMIHCVPGAGGRVPDGIETLRWSVETGNGMAQLRVLKSSRYGSTTVGLQLVGRRRQDMLLLAAAKRFAGETPFAIAAVRVQTGEEDTRFLPSPEGWTRGGSCSYERQHAAERAA